MKKAFWEDYKFWLIFVAQAVLAYFVILLLVGPIFEITFQNAGQTPPASLIELMAGLVLGSFLIAQLFALILYPRTGFRMRLLILFGTYIFFLAPAVTIGLKVARALRKYPGSYSLKAVMITVVSIVGLNLISGWYSSVTLIILLSFFYH